MNHEILTIHWKMTDLIFAALDQDKELIAHLLTTNSTLINVKESRNGYTALMCSSKPEITKLLLENGADSNIQDNNGYTALMLNSQYPEIIQLLLEYGADPNIQDNNGNTALLLFSLTQPFETDETVCRLLLEKGANPNIQNKSGSTVLVLNFRVLNFRHQLPDKIIYLLLDYGADPTIKDDLGHDGVTTLTQKYVLEKEICKLKRELELSYLNPCPGKEFIKLFYEENPNCTFNDFLESYIPILQQNLSPLM
jgi:ankyrin repeat protein